MIDRELSESDHQETLSLSEIRRKAQTLIEQYRNQLATHSGHKEDFPDSFYTGTDQAIDHFLRQIPTETLKRYWGHGITKGTEEDQLTALLAILEKGLIAGSAAGLTTGQPPAYTDGCALVLSKLDGTLMRKINDMPVFHNVEDNGRIMKTWEADIGAIVLNSTYYPLVGEFKTMYPNVQILKANESPAFLHK
jgi:hypothetical protein